MKNSYGSRSIMMAVALGVAVAVWMTSGLLGDDDSTAAPSDAASRQDDAGEAPSVSVRTSEARPVVRETVISARSEPNRAVDIAAETEGRVVSIDAERGARVAEGERIVGLDMRDRAARISEAEALLAQRELEHRAAERLHGQDLMSETQIAEAKARVASARAALENIELEIARTSIAAPFDGVLAEREVELGDYVGIGDTIATIVDTDPLVIVGDVSENELFDLDVGTRGEAELRDGKTVTGTVRYVAPVAAESTRTFRVELAIPNPEGALRAGMSAEVRLPAGEIVAHKMTPALLTLDDDGNVGVKTVDSRDIVGFFTVDIVRSGNDGVWVAGLPDRVRVITVGQGFVAAGERVEPAPAEQAARISGEYPEIGHTER